MKNNNSAYKRARSNYLSRVRALEKQGYVIERIPIPKKPTIASIRRLEKQTTKQLKQKSPLVDVLTGEIVDKPTTSKRKQVQRNNKMLLQYKDEIQRELTIKTTPKRVNISDISKTLNLPDHTDIIIQNFESSVDLFIPPVRDFINRRLADLTRTPEQRIAFAKAIQENPDYVPVPEDSCDKTIAYKFAELARIMNIKLEEMQEVTDTTDIVEQE